MNGRSRICKGKTKVVHIPNIFHIPILYFYLGGGQVPSGSQREQVLAHRQGDIPQQRQKGKGV